MRYRPISESHPDGDWDDGDRWYPSDNERQQCCANVRSPSRAHPYSRMTHCRSIGHIAELFNVNAKAVRKIANKMISSEKYDNSLTSLEAAEIVVEKTKNYIMDTNCHQNTDQ